MSDVPVPDMEDLPAADEVGRLRRIQPILTLLIAVVAIALAAWEGYENRRHNRLAVVPQLDGQVEMGRQGDEEYARMEVESTGLGPAVIEEFHVYLDGVLQDSTQTIRGGAWNNVIEALSTQGTLINARAYGGGQYFPAGRKYLLFEARRSGQAPEGAVSLADGVNRLALQICYCSIYATDCREVVLATAPVNTRPCTR